MVSIDNTTQSIASGADFNLDLALSNAGYRVATVQLASGAKAGIPTGPLRLTTDVHITTVAAEALGHTHRRRSSQSVYSVTYAKQVAVANLSFKIFDLSGLYIALREARIIGSTLRLTFRNYHSIAVTLWVRGQALVF